MRLTLHIPDEAGEALQKVAASEGIEIEIAASVAIVMWLVGEGLLELPDELDEDTPTEGTA
ncbi:MAG TPA: hypothetical protein VGN97_12220 [Mesorhizobium sp.]|jgi:hypothetical protein|nr:hypothetical protein [Mesorhizobium sp.]